MDHSTKKVGMQVADRLRHLAEVTASLEASGVRIISAEVSRTRNRESGYVLVSVHDSDNMASCLACLRSEGVAVEFDWVADGQTELVWEFGAEFNGVRLGGYLTEDEKAAWDEMEAG